MRKTLNIPLISQKVEELGLSQTKISQELGVSRESVSQWFKGDIFPRPNKLLLLGKILNVKYIDLVTKENEFEPIVAFRKVGNAITTERHYKRAKEMGFALEKLIKYLPFEILTKPPELIKPQNNYHYIQAAVTAVREKLEIMSIKVEADEIIRCFSKFKTILIPVLIGDKKNHENSLHIHLPESHTNWVYINLDTKAFDFKFWLVHELGHVFTPSLKDIEAEEFADNFAGAFLFPSDIAKETYESLLKITEAKNRIKHILNLADRYVISPYTIFKEVNKYAASINKIKIELGSEYYGWVKKFMNSSRLVSEMLFGKGKPGVYDYISVVEREFDTLFFKLLKDYYKEENSSAAYIRSVLNISVVDSKEIYKYLIDGI